MERTCFICWTHVFACTHTRMGSGNHIERRHSELRHLPYESCWGHSRPQQWLEHAKVQAYSLHVDTSYGLTVRHPPAAITATFPPFPPQEESQWRKWVGLIIKLQIKSLCRVPWWLVERGMYELVCPITSSEQHHNQQRKRLDNRIMVEAFGCS